MSNRVNIYFDGGEQADSGEIFQLAIEVAWSADEVRSARLRVRLFDNEDLDQPLRAAGFTLEVPRRYRLGRVATLTYGTLLATAETDDRVRLNTLMQAVLELAAPGPPVSMRVELSCQGEPIAVLRLAPSDDCMNILAPSHERARRLSATIVKALAPEASLRNTRLRMESVPPA